MCINRNYYGIETPSPFPLFGKNSNLISWGACIKTPAIAYASYLDNVYN